MVDPSTINEIVAAVEKEYGEQSMHKGSEAQRVARIPFPSLELNIASGGGIPLGRISRVFGAYSSGKTLTMLNIISAAQKLNLIAEQMLESKIDSVKRRGEELLEKFPNGMEAAYYNIEKSWDKEFAKDLGIDTDRLFVVEGSVLEKVGTIIEASLGGIHLHIIDSASAAVTYDELNSDIEDWHRAIKARAWGKVLDHIQEKIDSTENSVVVIDQARTNQKTGAEMAPGGNKLDHASSMTVHFRRGKWLYDREGLLKPDAPKTANTIHGKPEADGFEIQARVVKSKVGRPFRVARLQIDFKDMKFDQLYELSKAAKWFNVVDTSGSWYTLPSGDKVQGDKGLRKAIQDDPNLHQATLDAANEYIQENP